MEIYDLINKYENLSKALKGFETEVMVNDFLTDLRKLQPDNSKLPNVNDLMLPKIYEIDFDGSLKCKIRVHNNKIYVEAAMNGYGNGMRTSNIGITELN